MNNTTSPTYRSLEEIRQRKLALLNDIQADDRRIQSLWTSLFHKPEALYAPTPSKRLSGLVSTGAGIIDGILLGWKLYRKFNKGRGFRRR